MQTAVKSAMALPAGIPGRVVRSAGLNVQPIGPKKAVERAILKVLYQSQEISRYKWEHFELVLTLCRIPHMRIANIRPLRDLFDEALRDLEERGVVRIKWSCAMELVSLRRVGRPRLARIVFGKADAEAVRNFAVHCAATRLLNNSKRKRPGAASLVVKALFGNRRVLFSKLSKTVMAEDFLTSGVTIETTCSDVLEGIVETIIIKRRKRDPQRYVQFTLFGKPVGRKFLEMLRTGSPA